VPCTGLANEGKSPAFGGQSAPLHVHSEPKRAPLAAPNSYRVLAAALGQMGRTAEAKEALEQAIAIGPAAFDAYVRGRFPGCGRKITPTMHEGLRKAGLPEE